MVRRAVGRRDLAAQPPRLPTLPSSAGPAAKPRPRGFLRLMLKVPPLLYRTPLARRLGRRLLVLTTTGRRSGRPRRVGLNYAIDGEVVYVMSGFGRTDWLRNLVADPRVRVQIGTDAWSGEATLVRDLERVRRTRRLFQDQAGRQGPPPALRGLIRRLGIDYETELHKLDDDRLDLPLVEIRRPPVD